MTREEFIMISSISGYGSRKAATAYADQHHKEEYTDHDFIELHHRSMRWDGCKADKGLKSVAGINGKTTAMSNGIKGNSGVGQDWEC